MYITVIGTGYVGLVTAGCLASKGHHVTCLDNNPEKINLLQRGGVPFYEPGLEGMVEKNISQERIVFTSLYEEAMAKSDVIFIAVGTPLSEQGELNLSSLFQVSEQLSPFLNRHQVVVIKSTAPVGTVRKISTFIQNIAPHSKFEVVSNPEFLRAGSAVNDFMHSDRIVLGSEGAHSRKIMRQLYEPWVNEGTPLIETTPESAEIIKQASNAFLATKLSFINELSDFCEVTGANIQDVTEGLKKDPRIGADYLSPGPGFGGSCLHKDSSSLVSSGSNYGLDMSVIKSAVISNQKRKKSLAEKVVSYCGGVVEGKKIAILGLAFKEGTDDMRESPSLDLISGLQALGANLIVYDPFVSGKSQLLFPNIKFSKDVYEALNSADAMALMTACSQFKTLNFLEVKEKMTGNTIIDMRNIFEKSVLDSLGFQYYPIGSSYTENDSENTLKQAS